MRISRLHLIKHFLPLILLLWLNIAKGQEFALAHPIAYIGDDGNLYLSHLETSYALTTDANLLDSNQKRLYAAPRWSAEGDTLGFLRKDNQIYSILVAFSGQEPQLVFTESDEFRLQNTQFALSPDGRYLVFGAFGSGRTGLYKLNLENLELGLLIELDGTSYNGDEDPALGIARESFLISWGETGIIYGPTDGFLNIVQINAQGERIWTLENYRNMRLSADGSHLAAWSEDEMAWVSIDTSTGEITILDIPPDSKPLGFLDEQLYYATITNLITVTGDRQNPVGTEVYGYDWGFEALAATFTLYLIIPEAEDILLTQITAYDLTWLEGQDMNHFLLRYVSSSLPAVLAINQGASAEEVLPILARPIYLYLSVAYKTGAAIVNDRYQIPGTDASYSMGEFRPWRILSVDESQ